MAKRLTQKTLPNPSGTSDVIDWRDFDASWLPGGKQAALVAEFETYRDRLDELLQHDGQFVVIKGKSILGYYPDRASALSAAHAAYGVSPVLIKQVAEKESARRLGNVSL